jgi:biofilm PGA synthesis N-glycosyltransferase PgaC
MMLVLFWVSVAVVAYVYAGYPVALRLRARLRVRPVHAAAAGRFTPGVSIVVAARNEGARLGARLENLLAQDYPADRRQIIVVSDGSSDDTLEVLARYRGVVDAIALPPGGKALALNAGVAAARFEVVVFADARQVFAPDALSQLVAPLADSTVGAVTGELLLDCESALFSNRRAASDRRRGHVNQLHGMAIDRRVQPDRRAGVASTIADGVGMYWRYEKELRRLESLVWSTLGATGAIYAVRRALWQPLPPDTLLDDVLTPMRVVLAGFRVVFNDKAQAFDRAAVDADAESRRKVRTLAGNYQILWLEPRLLLPWHNPVWVQYFSHKLGRLVVPYAWLAAFSANIVLAGSSRFFQVCLAGQVGFFLLAGYGAVLEFATQLEAKRRGADTSAGPAIAAVQEQATREVA